MQFALLQTTCSLAFPKRHAMYTPDKNDYLYNTAVIVAGKLTAVTGKHRHVPPKTPRTCCLILQHPVNMKKHKHPGHTTIGCSFLRRDNGNSEPPCFNHLWDTQRRRACDTENNPVALLPWHQHLEDARVVNRVFGLLPLLTDSYLLGF
jgi:hypothetical protein